MVSAAIILTLIVAFMWLEYLWGLILLLRQINVYKTKKKIPDELQGILDIETFENARLYGLDKSYFEICKGMFSIIINTAVICLGIMSNFWQISETLSIFFGNTSGSEIIISCYFIVLLNLISTIIDLPFTLYYTFVLEEKHNFNKQTTVFFIIDHFKSFVITQVIIVPITAAIVFIVQRGGDMLVVWLWMFIFIVVLLLIIIYPSVIAPLFDNFSPLPDGKLRTSIEKLAASLKFPLSQLYVIEGSKRSAHSNAYFYGLFKTKRIVLFDTLIENYVSEDKKNKPEDKENKSENKENKPEEKTEQEDKPAKKKGCTDEEVLAILAHELGHWNYAHIYINLIIMQLNFLLAFIAFGLMFKYAPLYTALGFPTGVQPIFVGLVTILQFILAPYNALLSFGMTILSRKFEFQADNYAVTLGHAANLEKALIKLNSDNLGFPIYDSWYSAWHHSHPTLLQRIENLKKKQE